MNEGTYYILDQNVFIQAKNQYYAFAICPGFWDAVVEHHNRGNVRCIDKMVDGLTGFGDDLSEWVETILPPDCFVSTENDEVALAYAEIMTWANGNTQFLQYAKDQFAEEEDAWIAAHALVNGHTVVTQEVYNEDRRNKVSLAHVCEIFGIRYLNTFEFLRELNISMTFSP